MASNRSRGNESLGGRLERINSKIARNEMRRSELVTNSVTEEALAPGAASGEVIPDGSVTGVKLARGAVTTENLGIVNTVYSDGDVTFVMPPDGTLNVDGGAYTLPAAGTSTAIRLNSVGELAPWTGSPAIATVDLNDYTVPGEYHQASNAQAAAGLNYPIGHAGSLTVKAAEGGAFIYQTYHSYEDFNNLYFRGRYLGQWAPWAETVQATNPRLQATAPSVTGDWNNVLDTGFYRGSNLANKPGADDWYYVTVIRHDDTYVVQTATSYRNNLQAGVHPTYIRAKEAGTWRPWQRVAYAGVLGTPFATAQGMVDSANGLASGAGLNLTVNFPSGRFTVPPRIFAIASSGRLTCASSSGITTSSAVIRVDNNSTGANTAFSIYWQAIQMTSTSSDG